MSDHVMVDTGQPPWKPTVDTELEHVFHEYTIPLVGVFSQDGVRFLFFCVVGHAAEESAWAYARVGDDDVARLVEADTESFDQVVRDCVADRCTVFAIAKDDRGASVSVTIDPPASFHTVYERGMERLHEKIQEAREEYDSLRRTFPLMRPPQVAPTGFRPRVHEPA